MFKTELLKQLNRTLEQIIVDNDRLYTAMRYALLAGGKRFRGCIILELAEIFQVENAVPVAVAVEYLHTYSLIHDDLPAMDNATMRRGQQVTHLKFDEATAILAGDALLTDAFEIITDCHNIAVVKAFAQATGSKGMVQGQMLDMLGETQDYSAAQIRHMQSLKTGALIAFCFESVGLLKKDIVLAAYLKELGQYIGRLFQVTDDLLDVQSDSIATGKDSGHDGNKSVLSNMQAEIIALKKQITAHIISFQNKLKAIDKTTSTTKNFQKQVQNQESYEIILKEFQIFTDKIVTFLVSRNH